MVVRPSAALGLLAGALAIGGATTAAHADTPAAGAAPAAAASAPAPAPTSAAAARGAVVVSLDEGGRPAARALARSLYRDPLLRPALDEASAQVLAGDPAAEDAPAAVKEIAEVRRSAAQATSEPVARRLLASLGASAGAALVVTVTAAGGHPVARVLRVTGASYAPLELGATVQRAQTADVAAPQEGPAASIDWPGAASSLRALLQPSAGGGERTAGAPARALAPARAALPAGKADRGAPEQPSIWSSPWFWGSLGAVVAAGATVLILSQTSNDDASTAHVIGRIAP